MSWSFATNVEEVSVKYGALFDNIRGFFPPQSCVHTLSAK